MAQHDYVIANGTGAAVRSDLNNALAAIVSQNSGATEPTTTYAYQWWADTTTNLLKLRNAANSGWITLFQLDGEWSTIALENGSAGAPSIYFKDSGTDTGLYSPGTDQVGLSTGGTARLTIDSNGNVNIDSNTLYVDAANNRVGLGTSDPGSLNAVLAVQKSQTADTAIVVDNSGTPGASTTSSFILADGGSTRGWFRRYRDGSGNNAIGFADALLFEGNIAGTKATRMVIDSSGRVGIGSNAPVRQLDLYDATAPTFALHNATSGTGSGDGFLMFMLGSDVTLLNYENGYMAFNTNGTERARIDTSGRLLVGTSTSRTVEDCGGNAVEALLQIEKAGGSSALSLIANSNSSGEHCGTLNLGRSSGTALGSNTAITSGDKVGAIVFNAADGTDIRSRAAEILCVIDATPGANDMPGRLVFSTTADGASSPTTRMTIESTGSVKLENGASNLYRPGASGSGLGFSTNCTIPLNETGAASDNTENLGASGTRWATVYAGTGTINTSDANLKQDVDDLDAAELSVATVIKGLVKKYRFKDAVEVKGDDARIHVGVIAQEVEQAFVDAGLDPRRYALFCEDELEDGTKRLGIRYDELLAFVIAAL